jgi:hypothetical protein
MTETNGGRLVLRDVVALLREDIQASETRLREDHRDVVQRLTDEIGHNNEALLKYQAEHLRDHRDQRAMSEQAHTKLQNELDDLAIAKVREGGIVTGVLFLIRLLGDNWKILAILAGLLLGLSGRVDVNVHGP